MGSSVDNIWLGQKCGLFIQRQADGSATATCVTRPVKVYEELVYGYDWRKSEEVSGKRDFKQIIAQMERLGGGGTNKGARR